MINKYDRHFFTSQTAKDNEGIKARLWDGMIGEFMLLQLWGDNPENNPNLLKSDVSSSEPEREFDRDELYPEMEGNWDE